MTSTLAPLELREWDERIIEGYGPPSGADLVLARSLGERGDARIDIEWLHGDRLRVTSRSWVGVVRLERLEIRIRPKQAGSNAGLLRMLDYSSGLEALHGDIGRRNLSTGTGNLVDLICLLLVEEAEAIIRKGVLSDYVTREEALPALRGRLLIERQVAVHYGQVVNLECRHDEWEADILENRLVAAGLSVARRLCSDPSVRSRVARTAAAFSEICAPEPGRDLITEGRQLVYHRRNNHYRPAHQWALVLLGNHAVDDLYAPGRPDCFAFLLDMNILFERFIAKLLSDACAGTLVRVQRQVSDSSIIVDAGSLRSYTTVRPDLLVEDLSVTPHVVRALDTKYKLYDERRLDVSDLYQSFLYAYAFHREGSHETRVATLVYPSTDTSERHRLAVQSRDGIQGAIVRAVGVNIEDAVHRIGRREAPDPVLIRLLLDGQVDPTAPATSAVTEGERLGRLVVPFYLRMMAANALENDDDFLRRVVRVGRSATAGDVVALLRDPWRATVMGAWLAVFHNNRELNEVVLEALRASLGRLTAPPLATAAVLLSGQLAIPALQAYMREDLENGWGSADFVAAALDRLGATMPNVEPTDASRQEFSAMLSLAERLRAKSV